MPRHLLQHIGSSFTAPHTPPPTRPARQSKEAVPLDPLDALDASRLVVEEGVAQELAHAGLPQAFGSKPGRQDESGIVMELQPHPGVQSEGGPCAEWQQAYDVDTGHFYYYSEATQVCMLFFGLHLARKGCKSRHMHRDGVCLVGWPPRARLALH